MKKEEVEKWCQENNCMLLDIRTNNNDTLRINEVVTIAELSCRLSKGNVYIRTNKNKVVFARWLIYDYLKRMTNMSLADIGWTFARRDHSTVIHGLKVLENEVFMGWRKEYKNKFESKINEAHSKLGFKEIYI